MNDNSNNKAFSMIADIEGEFNDLVNFSLPDEVPILPVRNLVLFPGVVSPILIGRESSMSLIRKAEKKQLVIGVVCQHDPEVEDPRLEDLYEYGVYAKVIKQLTLPNGSVTAIVQALGRLRLTGFTSVRPYLTGTVESAPEEQPDKRDREFRTAMDDLRSQVNDYVMMSDDIPDEATFAIKNISNNVMALNFTCSNMPFTIKEKISLLETETVKERLFGVLKILNREIKLLHLKNDIRARGH